MKKKFFALMMAMVMVLSLAACSGSDEADSNSGDSAGGESSGSSAFKVGVIGPLTGGAAIYGCLLYTSIGEGGACAGHGDARLLAQGQRPLGGAGHGVQRDEVAALGLEPAFAPARLVGLAVKPACTLAFKRTVADRPERTFAPVSYTHLGGRTSFATRLELGDLSGRSGLFPSRAHSLAHML